MKLQLTISLLVSDRRETLKRCLDSIVPLLNEINSELIVVFTGKDPAVLEIVKQYTSRIIPFTWCDDFSKARNAGLTEAGGEWFLYLDDDEWFENVSEIVEFFKSGEYRNYDTAQLRRLGGALLQRCAGGTHVSSDAGDPVCFPNPRGLVSF